MRTTIVGREAEIGELERSLLPLTVDGSSIRLVLAAEPGFGKTVMLGHLVDVARSSAILTLSGRAASVGGSMLAFGPVAAALARHLDGLDPDVHERLTRGLPSLGRLVENITTDRERTADPDTERMRLFQAVALFLGRLSAEQPVLLAVDDLHWADVGTIELLSYLQAEVDSLPVGLVVALRPGDIDHRPEVRVLLGDLLRGRTGRRIDLGPLDDAAVGALATSLLDEPIAPDLAGLLARRSGGNPLAVEALVRELRSSASLETSPAGLAPRDHDIALPTYVLDLFGDRIDRLDDRERKVLLAVACAHRPATAAEVAAVTAIDPAAAADSCAHLERRHLVASARGNGAVAYEPMHALVAEASSIAAGERDRRRTHAAWSRQLRAEHATDAEIAVQVMAAGDETEAVEAVELLARAGRNAYDQGATDAAVRWLGAAAVRCRELQDPPLLAGVLGDLMRAFENRGEVRAAEVAGREAFELVRPNSPGQASLVAAHLAFLAWVIGNDTASERWSTKSVELGRRGTPAEALRALAERFYMLARMARIDLLDPAADELRAVIADVGPSLDGELATFSVTLMDAFLNGRDVVSVLGTLPHGWERGSAALRNHAFGFALEGRTMLGDWDGVRSFLATRAVEHTGVRAWRFDVAAQAMAWALGEWDLAADVLLESMTAGVDRTSRRHAMLHAYQLAHRGDAERARAVLADADENHVRAGSDSEIDALRAIAAVAIAWAEGTSVADAVEVDLWRDRGWLSMHYPEAATAEGEWRLARHDDEGVHALVARLRDMDPHGTRLAAIATRLEGLAAAADDPRTARATLLRAASMFDGVAMPFESARCRLEACEVFAEPEDASFLGPALAVLEALRAAPWAVRARRICGRQHRSRAAVTLTPREREVALLVAEGLTNAEIAERLVVSIRTVTSHLDHAYTKLGIGSRAALTAYVLRSTVDT